MIANTINEVIKIYNKIPKVFELKPNVFGYDKLSDEVHYEDGFRELVKPEITEDQYLTDLFFDDASDYYTYNVVDYTPEEIKERSIQKETSEYQVRQQRGLELYLRKEAEFRLLFLDGEITKGDLNNIEFAILDVRLELGFGQIKSALDKLLQIAPERIGNEIFNQFENDLNDLINELY